MWMNLRNIVSTEKQITEGVYHHTVCLKRFKIKHHPKIYCLGADISVAKLFLKSEGIGNTALGGGYSCGEAGAGCRNPQVALSIGHFWDLGQVAEAQVFALRLRNVTCIFVCIKYAIQIKKKKGHMQNYTKNASIFFIFIFW